MQVSRSPTARCTRTAATDESTPPERPQITRCLGPTTSRIRRDLRLHEVSRRPVRPSRADLEQEVAEDLTAARRVRHLGVKLHAEERPVGVLDRGDGRVVAGSGDPIPRRRDIHVVAVAHPDRRLFALAETLKETAALDPDAGAAVLPPVGLGDVAAAEMGEHLHTIAQPQHRRAEHRAARDPRSARRRHTPSWDRPRG